MRTSRYEALAKIQDTIIVQDTCLYGYKIPPYSRARRYSICTGSRKLFEHASRCCGTPHFVSHYGTSSIVDPLYHCCTWPSGAMASTTQRTLAACVLLACWLCQPCLGFLGSFPCSVVVGTAKGRRTLQRQRVVERTASVRRDVARRGRGTTRTSRTSASVESMVASPDELWQSYLGALEAAPLLTKVWHSL